VVARVPQYQDAPLFINSMSARFTSILTGVLGTSNVAPSSGAWPAAGRAIYVPLFLPFEYPVKRVFWVNGASVTGTADLGIYRDDFSRVFALGGAAQSGANSVQYTSVNLLLEPGAYYLALSLSNTAAMFRHALAVLNMREAGCLQEDSAEPLPSTMTPAQLASAYWPLFGLTRT